MIWLLEYMKIINLLYRGGAGGEFFGGLLVNHPEIATKELQYDKDTERWFLERDDWASQRPEVLRSEDPRRGVLSGRNSNLRFGVTPHYHVKKMGVELGAPSKEVPTWNKKLWNVRLDHGYGFCRHTDFWIDYLWNDWKETRTIIFKSRTEASLDYTQRLLQCKLGLETNDADAKVGQDMIDDGIFDAEQFWDRPWESDAYYFNMFMEMIPEDHDFLIVDPCELLHSNRVISRDTLEEVIDYIGIDNSLCDEWEETIESYRVKNKTLINNPII